MRNQETEKGNWRRVGKDACKRDGHKSKAYLPHIERKFLPNQGESWVFSTLLLRKRKKKLKKERRRNNELTFNILFIKSPLLLIVAAERILRERTGPQTRKPQGQKDFGYIKDLSQ